MQNIPHKFKNKKNTYARQFRMQATGADGNTIRVSVPRDVIQKEAKKLGIDVKTFLEAYRIEWIFNGFPGAYAHFVPKESEENNDSQKP